MEKVVIVLTIIIVILVGILGFFGFKLHKSNVKMSDILSSEKEVKVVETSEKNYGNRGNISQTERIKFLSKNDEYLVGMIGIDKSEVEKDFTNDDMIKFALNIAVYRYSSSLTIRKNNNGKEAYVIQPTMVNEITNEFFGNSNVPFDQKTNPYYSRNIKAFLYDGSIEKSLYYYPVSFEKVEVPLDVPSTPSTAPENTVADNTTSENPTEATATPQVEAPKETYTYITADAIFMADEDMDSFEKAKYEGAYEEKDVDNTIKFKFNKYGKLLSYQNM